VFPRALCDCLPLPPASKKGCPVPRPLSPFTPEADPPLFPSWYARVQPASGLLHPSPPIVRNVFLSVVVVSPGRKIPLLWDYFGPFSASFSPPSPFFWSPTNWVALLHGLTFFCGFTTKNGSFFWHPPTSGCLSVMFTVVAAAGGDFSFFSGYHSDVFQPLPLVVQTNLPKEGSSPVDPLEHSSAFQIGGGLYKVADFPPPTALFPPPKLFRLLLFFFPNQTFFR